MANFNYLIVWTDIYNREHKDIVQWNKPITSDSAAIHAIPHRGDIFKKLDKFEEVVLSDEYPPKWIPKPKPFAHSKVPVYEGPNPDFIEYASEFVPDQGDITDFDAAHAIAIELLKTKPDTVLNHEGDTWWVGRISPVKKAGPMVLYKNYDLYNTKGVDGPAKQGPGVGLYQNMEKYKSVSDFLKKKKKRIKKRQAALIRMFIAQATKDKNNLTDPYEFSVTPIPFAPAEPAPIGLDDGIYPRSDLEGKPYSNLYYGITDHHMTDTKITEIKDEAEPEDEAGRKDEQDTNKKTNK